MSALPFHLTAFTDFVEEVIDDLPLCDPANNLRMWECQLRVSILFVNLHDRSSPHGGVEESHQEDVSGRVPRLELPDGPDHVNAGVLIFDAPVTRTDRGKTNFLARRIAKLGVLSLVVKVSVDDKRDVLNEVPRVGKHRRLPHFSTRCDVWWRSERTCWHQHCGRLDSVSTD